MIDCFVCKWEEMSYMQEVLYVVLLYIVLHSFYTNLQENNYVSRTENLSIKEVILNAFIKNIYVFLEEKLLSSIHNAIRMSRKGKLLSYSKNYGKAVTIVLECLKHNKSNAKDFLQVLFLLSCKGRMSF